MTERATDRQDETTIDAETKRRVRDTLLGQATAELQAAQGTADREHTASEADEVDAVSATETPQSSQELGLAGELAESAAQQQADIDAIAALDVSPADTVRAGAIVGFDGVRYLVGVVAAPFDVDGATYEGLSDDAPIYASIAGLRLGDTFTFRDREHRIDFLA